MAELKTIANLACPSPLPAKDTVLLGHGSGGTMTGDLIREIFLPAFDNPVLAHLDDQAIVQVNGARLAFTTDSFVVKPLFFPGGDIGSLAVHGTVNDLAMALRRKPPSSFLHVQQFQLGVFSPQRQGVPVGRKGQSVDALHLGFEHRGRLGRPRRDVRRAPSASEPCPARRGRRTSAPW